MAHHDDGGPGEQGGTATGPANRENKDQQEVMVNNMALSVGNLYGLGHGVGEPRTVQFESVPELSRRRPHTTTCSTARR